MNYKGLQIAKSDFDFMVKSKDLESIKESELLKSLEKYESLIEKSTTDKLSEEEKEKIYAIKTDFFSYQKYDVISKSKDSSCGNLIHENYYVRPKQIQWEETEEIVKSEDGKQETVKKQIGTYLDTPYNRVLDRVGKVHAL